MCKMITGFAARCGAGGDGNSWDNRRRDRAGSDPQHVAPRRGRDFLIGSSGHFDFLIVYDDIGELVSRTQRGGAPASYRRGITTD